MNLDNLANLIDGGTITAEEAVTAESQYSRLADEAHQLRIENIRLHEVIDTINCAIEAVGLRPAQ